MWIDEAIWGHRLYDEQTPWLCFMEFLNVLQAEFTQNRAFKEQQGLNKLAYFPKAQLYIRNILFNNPQLEMINIKYKHDEAWDEWIKVMNKTQAGIVNADFNYLKERFGSFENFTTVVKFLQDTTIEGENNKRWSSQFVFPYGPACLYEDLKISEKSHTNDRRFFARTGELLYLMITRSGKGNEILAYLQNNVLNETNKFNRLVAALESPDTTDSVNPRAGAYLPYEKLVDYEFMGEDWINLLRMNIPNYDAIPHLVNITGLHLLLYSLNRAKEILQEEKRTTFVLEIISPKKTIIRDLSADSFIENDDLSRRAVEAYIKKIEHTEEWKEKTDIHEHIDILKREYKWPKEGKEHEIKSNEDIIEQFVFAALNRHKQHGDRFHGVWGKEIGLSSRRGTRRLRYAPQDALIKTLVLCIVPKRMEYQDFLEELYKRYGFIIGDKQAGDLTSTGRADLEAFSENAKRLEQRLSSMGLLRRLSDACAYVENPFAAGEELQ